MGIGKKALEIAEHLGIKKDMHEVMGWALEKASDKIEDEKTGVDTLRERLAEMSNEELALYVPNVYQKSIYDDEDYGIDYKKLWDKGIRFLSFDIDDTISDSIKNKGLAALGVKKLMPEDAEKLFEKLKSMGFTVTLLNNAHEGVAKPVCKQLKADGYIARAHKPDTANFEVMRQRFGVEKSQMAHIGNSMRDDVLGGNRFGITTCLVRRNGISMSVAKHIKTNMVGISTKGQAIRDELLKRDMFTRHHVKEKGDQYYQLGELPLYRQ